MNIERARSTSTNGTRAATLGTLLIIFLLGLGLRLYQLDTDSLWLDEVKAAITSRMDFVSMLKFQAEHSTHPPLLYIVNHFFLAFMGNSDFVLRLQAAFFGSLSLLLTYKLGGMLWTRKEGLIGAFLLATSAYHIRYSQEARHYALMIFLGLLSLVFLLKALHSGRKRMWILFGLCAGLNIYTHYFAFLILASETLFAAGVLFHGSLSSRRQQHTGLLNTPAPDYCQPPGVAADNVPPAHSRSPASSGPPDPRRQALRLAAVLAALGVSYLPWLPSMYLQLSGGTVQFEGLGEGSLPRAELSLDFFSKAVEKYTGVTGVLLLLFLALFALGLARSRPWHIALFGLWVVPPFVFPFVVRASHFFNYRYAVYIVPILSLGMARGIAVLTGWLTRRLPWFKDHQRRRLALASALTVFVFGTISLATIRDYYIVQKTDYRGLAGYLEHSLHAGDAVLADGITSHGSQDAAYIRLGLSYYMLPQRYYETPILSVERGLWTRLQNEASPQGEVMAVLARRFRPAFWDQQTDVVVVDFEDLSVIRLRQPTGDLLQDSLAMLEALTRLVRMADAQFDLRLALAEAYDAMGRELDAASQVGFASTVMPDEQGAIIDLEEARSQLHSSLDIQLEEITLGDSLSLAGHIVRPTDIGAGDAVSITLWWQAVATMERDYSAFVHILGPDGRLVLQQDRLLQSGNQPTSEWRVRDVVKDEYQLLLPPDSEPGQYVVITGVYYWETGERLPVWDADGQRLTDDTITLGTITLAAPK